ncbi:MAG: hypothetical protein IPN14_16980 [Bacteroidetes bacterium]|nr:hypothetical protein [Bacteroidota bacterium]
MKKNLPIILCIVLSMCIMLGCKLNLNIKIKYYTNEQMLNYVKEKKYPFHYILKFKTAESLLNKNKHNITSLNFMNFYAKNNQLIKASDGESCEFKIASYIKDSLHLFVENNNKEYSFDKIVAESDIITVNGDRPILADSCYKILVGWSINLNNYGKIQNRLKLLLDQINTNDRQYIIVGMNVDPEQ